MGQDCNQRSFRTTLSASIPHLWTALHATETAIIQPGLQSIAAGQDYLQLTKCLAGALPAGSSRPTVLVRSTRMEHRGGDSFCVSTGCFEVCETLSVLGLEMYETGAPPRRSLEMHVLLLV
jgi:hypothetical protein